MAFQPIVDIEARTTYAFEALVRGPEGQSAWSVLQQVNEQNRYAFDQSCRVKAITLATQLGLPATGAALSINFMPEALYSPVSCVQLTLQTAKKCGFPPDRLIFEFTETEKIRDPGQVGKIIEVYGGLGIRVALDDFGAGHAGLRILADLPAHILKIDMELIRNIDQRPRALALVQATVQFAVDFNTLLIAEGIETPEEFHALKACGIRYMQGYLFAKPAFEALPSVTFPD